MTLNVVEMLDARERASSLGLSDLADITFLPRYFWDADDPSQLVHEASVSTISVLLRQHGLQPERLRNGAENIPLIHENAFDWIAPVMFFSAAVLTHDPNTISIACGVMGNYVTEFFRGRNRKENIKVELLIETTKSKKMKKFTYEGDSAGLADLAKVIGEMKDE